MAKKYHDLVTEATNSKCYIWNVERYDPDGGVKNLSILCTEEEFDEIKNNVDPNTFYLSKVVDSFVEGFTKKVTL